MKKVLSFLFAALFSIAIIPSAFANTVSDGQFVGSFTLNDGTEITLYLVEADEEGISPRNRFWYNIQDGWADPDVTHSFTCQASEGNFFYMRATNIGDTDMIETYIYDGIQEYQEIVTPGNRLIAYGNSNSGAGLTTSITAKIAAKNTSSSANYSFTAEQYWNLSA